MLCKNSVYGHFENITVGDTADVGVYASDEADKNVFNDIYTTNINGAIGIRLGAGVDSNIVMNNYSLATTDILDFGTESEFTNQYHTLKRSIGTPGDAEDYNFTSVGNSNEQVLTLANYLPKRCRIVAAEVMCTETLAGSGTHEIVFQFGTTSSGEELIAATGAGTIDNIYEVRGIIDATKPAAIQMNWTSATALYLTGDPDANWDTLTAGKWVVLITYIKYPMLTW
jgi:hypothetical protein